MSNLAHSPQEIWKDIPDFKNNYQVSNFGKVRSVDGIRKSCYGRTKRFYGRILKTNKGPNQYPAVLLRDGPGKKKTIRVHRLVGIVFVPNPHNYKFINHKNGIKIDNRAENLEWCTSSENNRHAYKIGLAKPVKSWLGKINTVDRSHPVIQYSLDNIKIKEWPSISEAYRQLGFKINNIKHCLSGKNKHAYGYIWKYKFETKLSGLSQQPLC